MTFYQAFYLTFCLTFFLAFLLFSARVRRAPGADEAGSGRALAKEGADIILETLGKWGKKHDMMFQNGSQAHVMALICDHRTWGSLRLLKHLCSALCSDETLKYFRTASHAAGFSV